VRHKGEQLLIPHQLPKIVNCQTRRTKCRLRSNWLRIHSGIADDQESGHSLSGLILCDRATEDIQMDQEKNRQCDRKTSNPAFAAHLASPPSMHNLPLGKTSLTDTIKPNAKADPIAALIPVAFVTSEEESYPTAMRNRIR